MQAKGFIRFIIIALIVASIFQLSFTFIKSTIVNKAITHATNVTGEKDGSAFIKQKNAYLDSIKNEEAFFSSPMISRD